jgi:hypothetical protein
VSAAIQRRRQLGDAFGSLVVLVVLAVAGYFAYRYFISMDQPPPSCKMQLNRCSADCNKTATEASEMKACQDSCQQKAAACKD